MTTHHPEAVLSAADAILAGLQRDPLLIGLGAEKLREVASSAVVAAEAVIRKQEPSIELRTEQAYMSGVRFERARIAQLAREHRAICDCQCGMDTVASPKPGHVRAFADLIREEL